MDDLVKRLREPYEQRQSRRVADEFQAADRIEALERQVKAADALAEAGNVMSSALHGDYIVPGSAAKWDIAFAAYTAAKEGGAREADT